MANWPIWQNETAYAWGMTIALVILVWRGL